MPKKKQKKNRNETKKIRTNLRTNMKLFLIKFEICIFQLIAKILLNQQSFNQIRTCLTGHNQI